MPRTRANNGDGSRSKNGPVVVTQVPAFSDGSVSEPKAVAPTPLRRRNRTALPKISNIPVQPNPKAWASALLLAKGDASRLSVDEDGSVLVRNYSA